MIGLMGLVDCTDSRFMSTIDAIDKRLRMGPTVFRYLADDGLPGREGGFLSASWLVDSFYKAGRRDEAESLFESMIELAGPEGLLPEQYDPLYKEPLAIIHRPIPISDLLRML